jgi:hypothetical protein
MAIETARIMPLKVNISVREASGTIDLLQPRTFLAWITVTVIDPTGPFDRASAVAADIFSVDGNRTASRVFGGDHFEAAGDDTNVFQGAFFGVGQRINFWLRVFDPNVDAAAECVVVI